jgi:acyl-CoA thioesterase
MDADYRPDIARDMYDRDKASQGLGIRIMELGPGKAVLEMKVTNEMLNGLQTDHGGLLFAFADAAMAFATNQRENPAFAIHAEIDFLKPVLRDTVLTAMATFAAEAGRTTVVDVRAEAGSIMTWSQCPGAGLEPCHRSARAPKRSCRPHLVDV